MIPINLTDYFVSFRRLQVQRWVTRTLKQVPATGRDLLSKLREDEIKYLDSNLTEFNRLIKEVAV